MKLLFLIVGVLLVLLGLHWVGQGTLYFPWPSNPAMDGHVEFVYYGAITALVGPRLVFTTLIQAILLLHDTDHA